MMDPAALAQVLSIAASFDDPEREAVALRYHAAIAGAIAGMATAYTLDAVPLYEAIARIAAQYTDGAPADVAGGAIDYMAYRARLLRGSFSKEGSEAPHFIEPQGRA